VVIGRRSVIGAGSIVTKNIPEDVVAGGNPCKPIKDIPRASEEEIKMWQNEFIRVHVAPGYEDMWKV
jgi:serine acetyltransferase